MRAKMEHRLVQIKEGVARYLSQPSEAPDVGPAVREAVLPRLGRRMAAYLPIGTIFRKNCFDFLAYR
jgi:hypothetical protein